MTKELYVKAGPDGVSVGDCPFAHYVRAVLAYKNVDYEVIPKTKENKPDWLLNDHKGQMPCYRDGSTVLVESSAIAQYLDDQFLEPKLHTGEDVKEASAQLSGFFPAMAKFLKKVEFDPELEVNLIKECEKLSSLVEKSKGPYLCGAELSLLDLSLAPKLYHLKVALPEFHPQSVNKILCGTVEKYIEAVLASEPIASSSYPPETVLWGWRTARSS